MKITRPFTSIHYEKDDGRASLFAQWDLRPEELNHHPDEDPRVHSDLDQEYHN